jgi:Tfp pilus assembly protein PilF
MLRFFFPALLLILLAAGCTTAIPRTPVSQEDKAKAHRLILDGDKLLREGKDHLALSTYVEASTLDPYNELAFNKLAVAYSTLGMFREAGRAVDRAIRLEPEYSFAFNTRGIVQLANEDSKGAVKSFRKAISLDPQPLFHVNLGAAYLHRNNYSSAREAFVKAIALDPDVFRMEGAVEVATISKNADPEKHYSMALLFAQLKAKDPCLEYLSRALSGGLQEADRVKEEQAFDFLQEDEDFLQLVGTYGIAY